MEKKENNDEIIIEELLKKLRESKGWTYNDVAYRLNDTNILTEDIKKMESGLEYPDFDMMYKLSDLYMVPVENFVKAKEYSYKVLRDSFSVRMIKWINYFFGISFKAALVIVTLFYVLAFVGSMMFFVSKVNEFHERVTQESNSEWIASNFKYENGKEEELDERNRGIYPYTIL